MWGIRLYVFTCRPSSIIIFCHFSIVSLSNVDQDIHRKLRTRFFRNRGAVRPSDSDVFVGVMTHAIPNWYLKIFPFTILDFFCFPDLSFLLSTFLGLL
jgi:hypothetical protein